MAWLAALIKRGRPVFAKYRKGQAPEILERLPDSRISKYQLARMGRTEKVSLLLNKLNKGRSFKQSEEPIRLCYGDMGGIGTVNWKKAGEDMQRRFRQLAISGKHKIAELYYLESAEGNTNIYRAFSAEACV